MTSDNDRLMFQQINDRLKQIEDEQKSLKAQIVEMDAELKNKNQLLLDLEPLVDSEV